ncbi:hypothetical protein YC2023_033460 [Brassica napus]
MIQVPLHTITASSSKNVKAQIAEILKNERKTNERRSFKKTEPDLKSPQMIHFVSAHLPLNPLSFIETGTLPMVICIWKQIKIPTKNISFQFQGNSLNRINHC